MTDLFSTAQHDHGDLSRISNDEPRDSASEPVRISSALEDCACRAEKIKESLFSSLEALSQVQQELYPHLQHDISYGRLSSTDVKDLFDDLTRLQERSSGLAFSFDTLTHNIRHSHLNSRIIKVQQDGSKRAEKKATELYKDYEEAQVGLYESYQYLEAEKIDEMYVSRSES